jgi:2-oxoacid:acceptor oxidoreductase, delta subunit, pyruvate/2-ketoisovalerate family
MDKKTYRTPVGDKGMYVLNTSSWRTHRPVMEKASCVDCGLCMAYCPVNSVKWESGKGFFITYDYCKGCGICATECPKHAIAMVKEGDA